MNGQLLPRLLAIGPLPPPIAGTSVSFQVFCNLVNNHPERLKLDIINSAPKHLGQYPLFTRSHFETAQRIVRQMIEKVRQIDQVLIFGQDQFFLSMASICLRVAKTAGKPCYLRSIGGSLDNYYMGLRPLLRRIFRTTLNQVDGLIIETELNHQYFTQMLGNKVHYVPAYRPVSDSEAAPTTMPPTGGPLRAAYVGHIREEKGVFLLLESLRALAAGGATPVSCDFFGPIYTSAAQRFPQELAQTPNAVYRGVLNPDQVVPTLRQYDVMVFPTHYAGEGHPGVVVEAMIAGIPVITTRFRSIPELIKHEVNGLLIAPRNGQQLSQAIQTLHQDRALRTTLGQNNWAARTQFSATAQVPRILQPLGIQLF